MHPTRNTNNITPFKVRHNFFKNYFFPSVVSEWNKLDLEICNSASWEIFKKHLLNFIKSNSNNVFNINNPLGLKFLTRLRIAFSHNFLDTIFKILQALCVVVLAHHTRSNDARFMHKLSKHASFIQRSFMISREEKI